MDPVRDCDPTIFIATDRVSAGAGLVIEHVGPDGARTRQALPHKAQWDSEGEFLRVTSPTPKDFTNCLEPRRNYLPDPCFEIVVHIHHRFDLSRPGIYQISYVHPWADIRYSNMRFGSETRTVACISKERFGELNSVLRGNPELALASCKFKHPLLSETPSATRSRYLDKIKKAIKKGTQRDEVLFLLGSPDIVGHTSSTYHDYDETWLYSTGPASDYGIRFKNGSVIRAQ